MSAEDFAGRFELRDWKPPLRAAPGNADTATRLMRLLTTAPTALLVLMVGAPRPVTMAGGTKRTLVPLEGELDLQREHFRLEQCHISPEAPGEARGLLRGITAASRPASFCALLRRERLQVSLTIADENGRDRVLQNFCFYREGASAPARRKPEEAATLAPSVAPNPDAALAQAWSRRLLNTRFTRLDNDFQSSYGTSAYYERCIAIQLFSAQFELDRETQSHVSFAGGSSSAPSRTRLTGTWTVVVKSGQAELRLSASDGTIECYALAMSDRRAQLDGDTRWQWSAIV